jgi:AraC-like DNA-binding protein
MAVISSSSAWLRGVVHMFASLGVEPAALFADAGIDPDRLKKPYERFNGAEINSLWALAVARSGQSALGLDRQLARRFVNFDIAAQAMWPSELLQGGLESFSRYLELIGDAAGFTLQPERSDCWLVLSHSADGTAPRQRIEFGMLALLLLCQRVTRRPLRPLVAEFVYPEPPELHAHRMAFQCPLRFEQPANRLRLGREDLALHISSTTVSLFAVQERLIEDRLARYRKARTSYRVSEEIIRGLHMGEPRRAAIAGRLGLSDAALEQRLRSEGTAFEQLLEDVRKDLAGHYLAQSGYALGRTASLLGWATPADFAAACKRWFGLTPPQYRQQLEALSRPEAAPQAH